MTVVDTTRVGRLRVYALAGILLSIGTVAQAQGNGANGHLQIHYINVGQGDAQLIISPNGETVLIDTGPVSAQGCASPTGIITYLIQIGLTRLDYHVASHYDADHIGCSDLVVAQWPVQMAALDRGTANVPTTATYTRYASAVASKRQTVTAGQTILLDATRAFPVTIQVVAVNGNGTVGSLDENDRCVVLVVRFGTFDAEFGGDLTGDITSGVHNIESKVAAAVGQVEVYKVHHHGSATSSNATWMAAVHPRVAMLSMSATNSFGHPTQAALDRIHAVTPRVYWTTAGKGAPASSADTISGSSLVDVPGGGASFTVNYGTQSDAYGAWPSATTTSVVSNPSALQFAAIKNGAAGALSAVTAPQDVGVTFTGPDVPWAVTSNQSWLQITDGSANNAGRFAAAIVNPGNVIGGSTTLSATITITAIGVFNSPLQVPVTLTVDQSGGTAVPFGQVDTPVQNAIGVQGAIGVTGWALDDSGVREVRIYRSCLPFDAAASCQMILGANVVFVGQAAFLAGARPDVEAAFPGLPNKSRAGWGYLLLTNMLPHIATGQPYGGQGSVTLYALAIDIDDHGVWLGRTTDDHSATTVTLTNDAIAKPFGAIDTPGQGATVSGVVNNFGWSLTPDGNTILDATDIVIPPSGSSMVVFVDGAPVGTVSYNQCRGNVGNPVPSGTFCNDDVASIFGNVTPQPPLTARTANPTKYRNLDAGRAPIGAFSIDTTPLTNGFHTLAWGVTDSAGRTEGIGSRFFQVLNSGGDRPIVSQPSHSGQAASDRASIVWGRIGFDLRSAWTVLRPDHEGVRTLQLPELGRVELSLGAPEGWLVANGERRELPTGSHLDEDTGHFTWAPGPGFVGTYRFLFVRGSERLIIDITIRVAQPFPPIGDLGDSRK